MYSYPNQPMNNNRYWHSTVDAATHYYSWNIFQDGGHEEVLLEHEAIEKNDKKGIFEFGVYQNITNDDLEYQEWL